MTDEVVIGKGYIRAAGPFAITILVLIALAGVLVYQQYYFMQLQMTKFDEATWVMSLPNEAKNCLHLGPPDSMRSRVTGLPDLETACREYLRKLGQVNGH